MYFFVLAVAWVNIINKTKKTLNLQILVCIFSAFVVEILFCDDLAVRLL
jgi:hypothetical protein